MFDDMTNADRADRAEAALAAWRTWRNPDRVTTDEADLRDLICDLRHYARRAGYKWTEELVSASGNYREDVREERAEQSSRAAQAAARARGDDPYRDRATW